MLSFWSPQLEQALTRLLTGPQSDDTWVREQSEKFAAVPVIWSLWAFCLLRPCGEVVVVDSEFGEAPRVETERGTVLQILAWLARKHPQLREFFPTRDAGAVDCVCGSQTAYAPE